MATLGNILVHVDAGPHNAARLSAARELAMRHDAAVTALYAVMPSFIEVPFALEAAGPALDVLKALDDERLEKAKAAVERVHGKPGPRVEWAVADSSAPVAAFTQQAYYADLLVLGQREPLAHTSGVPADFVESVLLASGRPALVLPHIGIPPAIGRSVLIAWKECAEAVHALAAALPLLQRAERVSIVEWSAPDDSLTGPLDIRRHLARHGVTAELHHFSERPATTGELILSMAADLSADLIVMGCYGHSRARELVLGGATRTILSSMTVPVLMAH
jgi:nucleotide-binding universal stress UspA family protein